MKCIPVILLCSAALLADDVPVGFANGQAARLVIGQTTFTSQDPNSSDTILGAVSGLAYAADTLFVTDANRVGAAPTNHRVLLYQNLSSMLPPPGAELSYTRKCPVCLGQATTVLGQPDFTTTTLNVAATASTLRLPTAVASDGVHLAVADTDHNRVLIWNRIPTTNDAPADVVVGQPNLTSTIASRPPTSSSLLGPQGVWIQNGKLYVADTQDNRVLVYNQIPTKNGAAADLVLGAPNFTTSVETSVTQAQTSATASNMLNPVSVTSDGVRLYVADLGYNRVLIWSTLPSSNGAAADVVIGQPDMTSSTPNNAFTGVASLDTTTSTFETPVLCTEPSGTDANGKPTYPNFCNATLDFPRFALFAGNRLFIADGGNDRVLVFNQVPSQNGATADLLIGQIKGSVNQASDAADSLRTPMSMAWDGTNLYVSDAYNRRITVYSIGANAIPYGGVVNNASQAIFAQATVTMGGTIQAGDTVEITIDTTADIGSAAAANYTYTVQASDTLDTVIDNLAALINAANSGAGDPNVYASADHTLAQVILTARVSGPDGNNITLSATPTAASGKSSALITAVAAGTTLSGGGDAGKVAPGTVVSVKGTALSAGTASADFTQDALPTQLAGTEVYFNGIRAPLYYVSPTEISAQIPWELQDTTSINAFVRSVLPDGTVMTTTPVAATIVPANPGIYTQALSSPPTAVAAHGSSYATGIISVDGTVGAGDNAQVTIEDRTYSYVVQATDTLDSVRDALVAVINQDPKVSATAAGEFDRIILRARIQGPEGNGIPYSATQTQTIGNGTSIIVSAFGTATCCANVAFSPITPDNPAVAGEVILVYATGLGVPVLDDTIHPLIQTGIKYPLNGPVTVPALASFVSSLAGGRTADVLTSTLQPGGIGTYLVTLHLNSSLTTDPRTQLTISQDEYTSNVVTIPVVTNPNP